MTRVHSGGPSKETVERDTEWGRDVRLHLRRENENLGSCIRYTRRNEIILVQK